MQTYVYVGENQHKLIESERDANNVDCDFCEVFEHSMCIGSFFSTLFEFCDRFKKVDDRDINDHTIAQFDSIPDCRHFDLLNGSFLSVCTHLSRCLFLSLPLFRRCCCFFSILFLLLFFTPKIYRQVERLSFVQRYKLWSKMLSRNMHLYALTQMCCLYA